MKKVLKNYLLFFSRHPVAFSFIFGLLVIIAIAVGRVMNGPSHPGFHVSLREITLVFCSVVVHIIFLYFVIDSYITRPQRKIDLMFEDTNSYLFCALKTEEGKIIIVDEPIWQKGKKYFVLQPRFYYWGMKQFRFTTMVVSNGSFFCAGIQVSLEFYLERDFDRLELATALIKSQGDSETLDLGKYITDIFVELNKPRAEQIDLIIATHRSIPRLLGRITNVLVFPKKLFPNVLSTMIILDTPAFSAGKTLSD